ncbi:hypothetical protein C8R44DRAFT_787972 [Mycena epipterygia]|nr:hypothetical protein C8R44DRAFT_787972 [Mycena epipterygia]
MSIDIFGVNNYEWCGNALSTTFDGINAELKDYNVVAYLNCSPSVRPWTETDVLLASPMTEVWSGGLAFSYFPPSPPGTNSAWPPSPRTTPLCPPTPTSTRLAIRQSLLRQQPLRLLRRRGVVPGVPRGERRHRGVDDAAADAERQRVQLPGEQADLSVYAADERLYGRAGGADGRCVWAAAGVKGTTKLSYAFSQYYELSNRAATACSFSGNATINSAASTSTVSDAVSACLPSPSAVFTPTSPSGSSGSSSGGSASSGSGGSGSGTSSGSGAGSTGGAKNGALARLELGGLMGGLVMVGCVLGGMGWTLSL